MRSKAFLALSLLAAVLAILAISLRWAPTSSAFNASSEKQPVIVELFTSEGCSSCPPAEALLKQLSDEQPLDGIEVIPLEEHVDYWNHLGWSDPFSSESFTRRQNDYSFEMPKGGVFTPQMVVDGSAQLIGSRSHEAREQIQAAAAHPKPRLIHSAAPASNPRTRSFELRLDPNSAPPLTSKLDFYIAVTEKGLSSKPNAGENSGETLQHAAVVRELRKVQRVNPPFNTPVNFTVDLRENWTASNLNVVAFFADSHRRIHAAGSAPIVP